MKYYLCSFFGFFYCCSCTSNAASEPDVANYQPEKTPVAVIAYTITNVFPHDTTLFTEGLFFKGNTLFESTGSPAELPKTKSMAGILDVRTGNFEKKIEIDRNKFLAKGLPC